MTAALPLPSSFLIMNVHQSTAINLRLTTEELLLWSQTASTVGESLPRYIRSVMDDQVQREWARRAARRSRSSHRPGPGNRPRWVFGAEGTPAVRG